MKNIVALILIFQSLSLIAQEPVVFHDGDTYPFTGLLADGFDIYLTEDNPGINELASGARATAVIYMNVTTEDIDFTSSAGIPGTDWFFVRDLVCSEGIDPTSLDESGCSNSFCSYLVPAGEDYIEAYAPSPYYHNQDLTDHYLKIEVTGFDFSTVGYIEYLYKLGTVDTDIIGFEYEFDDRFYGEFKLRIHINGGECGMSSSFNELEGNNGELTISPNPTIDNSVNISYNASNASDLEFLVKDINGKLVKQWTGNQTSKMMDLSGFGAGMYFVSVMNMKTGYITTEKLIVSH